MYTSVTVQRNTGWPMLSAMHLTHPIDSAFSSCATSSFFFLVLFCFSCSLYRTSDSSMPVSCGRLLVFRSLKEQRKKQRSADCCFFFFTWFWVIFCNIRKVVSGDYRLFLSARLQMEYAFEVAILHNFCKTDSKDKHIYLEDCETVVWWLKGFRRKISVLFLCGGVFQRKRIRLIRFTDI